MVCWPEKNDRYRLPSKLRCKIEKPTVIFSHIADRNISSAVKMTLGQTSPSLMIGDLVARQEELNRIWIGTKLGREVTVYELYP